MHAMDGLAWSTPGQRVGPFAVVRALGPRAALASGAGGRRVVLKPIDEDCMLELAIHPSVATRLERIQQLPTTALAHLIGVWRIEGCAVMAWEFVEARSLEEVLADPRVDAETLVASLRDAALAIEAMHGLGIVHGAVHERNIFVQAPGVLLTHASPLLWDDPAADEQAFLLLAERAAGLRGTHLPTVPAAIRDARASSTPLASFRTHLARPAEVPASDAVDPLPKRLSLLGAAITTVIAIIVTWLIWRAV
jgi:hypothetical protein